jgi:hypothetical protein
MVKEEKIADGFAIKLTYESESGIIHESYLYKYDRFIRNYGPKISLAILFSKKNASALANMISWDLGIWRGKSRYSVALVLHKREDAQCLEC